MSFFLETKQQSQATTVENLKSETGWEFTVLLIKKTECKPHAFFTSSDRAIDSSLKKLVEDSLDCTGFKNYLEWNSEKEGCS